jgi:hypothetical protein
MAVSQSRRLTVLASLLLAALTQVQRVSSFVVQASSRPAGLSATLVPQADVSVSKDHYDVVKVDLADGRDYPIYIGTGYSEQEGEL